jgi:hypothetical protein
MIIRYWELCPYVLKKIPFITKNLTGLVFSEGQWASTSLFRLRDMSNVILQKISKFLAFCSS